MLEDYSSNLPPKQTKNTKKEFTIVVKYPFEPRITEEKFLRQFQAGDCPREISAKWDFEFLFVMFQMKPPIWSSLFPRLQVIHSKYKLYFWQTWGSPLWVFGIFHDIFFRSHGWLGGFRPKCILSNFPIPISQSMLFIWNMLGVMATFGYFLGEISQLLRWVVNLLGFNNRVSQNSFFLQKSVDPQHVLWYKEHTKWFSEL